MATAAVINQTTLQSSIDGYLRRSFTTAELDQFVLFASRRLGRDLRSTEQQLIGSLRPVGGIAELPARCVEVRSVQLVDGTQLQSWGFNAGQVGTATGDERLYRILGISPDSVGRVELWPANTDATATKAVTSLTSSTNLATLTTTADHDLASGAFVDIAGVVEAGYNGTHMITVTSDTVFTFPIDPDVSDTTTGTITVKPCTILVHYFEQPDPDFTLGDANPVIEAHPEVYLYASLAEAASYVKDIDAFSLYSGLYTAEVDRINKQARKMRWGSFPAAISNVNHAATPARGL